MSGTGFRRRQTKFFQFHYFGDQIVRSWDNPTRLRETDIQRHHCGCTCAASSRYGCHGQHSFHSYPLIIRAAGFGRCGAGPEVAHQGRSPKRQPHAPMRGFNDRNLYPRQTPCDQELPPQSWPAKPPSRKKFEEVPVQPRHVVGVYKGTWGVRRRYGLFIRRRHVPRSCRTTRDTRARKQVALRRAQPSRVSKKARNWQLKPSPSGLELPLATLLQSVAAFALRRGRRAVRGDRRTRIADRRIGSDGSSGRFWTRSSPP